MARPRFDEHFSCELSINELDAVTGGAEYLFCPIGMLTITKDSSTGKVTDVRYSIARG